MKTDRAQVNAAKAHATPGASTLSPIAATAYASAMDHDAAWKRLFGLPILVEHLLRGFAGSVAGLLDFGTLRQLAERKFDRASADELARRLAGVKDAEYFARVGGWIIDCGTAEELLDRMRLD